MAAFQRHEINSGMTKSSMPEPSVTLWLIWGGNNNKPLLTFVSRKHFVGWYAVDLLMCDSDLGISVQNFVFRHCTIPPLLLMLFVENRLVLLLYAFMVETLFPFPVSKFYLEVVPVDAGSHQLGHNRHGRQCIATVLLHRMMVTCNGGKNSQFSWEVMSLYKSCLEPHMP